MQFTKICIWLFLFTVVINMTEEYHEELLEKLQNSENKESTWDVKFDCDIRKLAYQFAGKVSLGMKDNLKYIYDGLELSKCNVSFDKIIESEPWNNANILNDGNDGIKVFVDNTHGREFNSGEFESPLPTIQMGIDRCKTVMDSSLNCTVYVRHGIYRLLSPIKIDRDNIRLRRYTQDKVQVTSNVVVKPSWKAYKVGKFDTYHGLNPIFEKLQPKESTNTVKYAGVVSNVSSCQTLCITTYSSKAPNCTSFVYFNTSVKGFENQCYIRNDGRWNTVKLAGASSGKKINIYSADLSSFNLTIVDQIFVAGRRAVRARFPNGNPEYQGLHTVPTGYVNDAVQWIPPKKSDDPVEIHIETPKREATLFPAFQLGIDGSVKQFDPPQSYWGTKHPFGGGGSTYKVPAGLKYDKDIEIDTREWKNPSTGIIHAFQNLHWENWMFQLDGRNHAEKTLAWSWGGFQGARGSSAGKEWYVENIFEELDVPGEWFYDEDTKMLYLYPNNTDGSLPTEISIPQLPSLLQVVGSQDRPVKNTAVTGISFFGTTQTFLEKYMVPSGGDWSVHRNGMVYIEGTENFFMSKCTLESSGGNGIFVHNYNRGSMIAHNLLHHLGDNGIVLVGEARLIDGSVGNQPRGIQLYNNVIFDNGIWGKQTYPFVQSVTCETHLERNIFFNGPRAGMNFNDGFGGGNTIYNNLLFNFVRETDDHGPINTWDRVPYLTRVGDGKTLSLSVKENQIHRNFIINNYRSVWPIDHDDGTCYWNDTHNFLVYGGFKNYLGHDKISRHNIYVYPDRHPYHEAFNEMYCADTAGQTLGTSGYGDLYENNKCVFGGTSSIYSLGSCTVANITSLIPHFGNNELYTKDATYKVVCGKNVWDIKEAQLHGIDLGTKISDLPDNEEVIEWGRDLLDLHFIK